MPEDFGEFNEKFETIEQTLKYIADSQAKADFEFRRSRAEFDRRQSEFDKRLAALNETQEKTEKHLQYLSKLVGISLNNYQFQEEKLQKAGEVLSTKLS